MNYFKQEKYKFNLKKGLKKLDSFPVKCGLKGQNY